MRVPLRRLGAIRPIRQTSGMAEGTWTAAERKKVLAALDEAISAAQTVTLEEDLLRQGWTSEAAERFCAWFQEKRYRIEGGWTPSRADEVNMGMWFDYEGISPYAEDVLKQAFRRAARALAGPHP